MKSKSKKKTGKLKGRWTPKRLARFKRLLVRCATDPPGGDEYLVSCAEIALQTDVIKEA